MTQSAQKQKEISRKEFDAARTLKKVMADHFYELNEAAKTGSKKIGGITRPAQGNYGVTHEGRSQCLSP